MAAQRSLAVGLVACVVTAIALAIRGAEGSRMLVLATSYWQVGGAGLIAMLWWQRRAARLLVFMLLCLAIWAGWSGVISSLAFSAALAFYVNVLNHIGMPLTRLRRWVGSAALTLDGVAATLALFPAPTTWILANLVILDIAVVVCSALAIASARDERRFALWIVLPIVSFATVVTLYDAAALLAISWVSSEFFETTQCAIAFAWPICFAIGLISASGCPLLKSLPLLENQPNESCREEP